MDGVSPKAAGKPGVARTRGRRAKTLVQYAGKPIFLIMRYIGRRPVAHALVLLGIAAAVGCGPGSQFAIKNLTDQLPAGRDHPAPVVTAFLIIVVLMFADTLFWRLSGWISVRTFIAVTGDVRRHLFGYLVSHSPGYFRRATDSPRSLLTPDRRGPVHFSRRTTSPAMRRLAPRDRIALVPMRNRTTPVMGRLPGARW